MYFKITFIQIKTKLGFHILLLHAFSFVLSLSLLCDNKTTETNTTWFSLIRRSLCSHFAHSTHTYRTYSDYSPSRTMKPAELANHTEGNAEAAHIAAAPHTEDCVGMAYVTSVCRGVMACRLFVCTRHQSVNAAFFSSAPLQTVYGGIPLRLSVALSMASLGRWPNSFWTQ